jgi:dTDP-glucose pyrophosphorylase/predicted transcriptional regulator
MLIHDLQRVLVPPTANMRDVIAAIDKAELQVALVVDSDRRLLGTITDGDVRRAILRGATLDVVASTTMNPMPIVAGPTWSETAIEALMKRTGIRRIPVVDSDGIVVGLTVPRSEAPVAQQENLVVIMAGGLGTRLADLTKDRPKPLLEVGHKPILETIVERFVSQGFTRLTISVNYKAEMIETYFGDGSRLGARIDYVHEHVRLGTAGGLQFLPHDLDIPVIVVNGDVLTTVDYRKLLTFHRESERKATMGVSFHDVQVPYGVVTLLDQQVRSIAEKPVYRYFVNAGIYVLEPSCLHYLPKGEYFDMTTLFERMLTEGNTIAAYPIHEYWQDVGQRSDYEQANRDFGSVFERGAS